MQAVSAATALLLSTMAWPVLVRPATAQAPASEVYHFVRDHLGSVQVVVDDDPSGNGVSVVEEIRYWPYGEIPTGGVGPEARRPSSNPHQF